MADIDTAPKADTQGNTDNPVETMKSFFLDNSQVKPNGVREVNKAGFSSALLAVGVSGEDVKRVQSALDNATTAAAEIAADDLENKLNDASKDDLANAEYRQGMSAMVRLPTPGGKTEVEVKAEKVSGIPFRGDADGNGERQTVTKHGVIRVSVNGTGRIAKDLPGSVSDRIKARLGV